MMCVLERRGADRVDGETYEEETTLLDLCIDGAILL
jgi:hypothetical protein